jgi:hypothetical protein
VGLKVAEEIVLAWVVAQGMLASMDLHRVDVAMDDADVGLPAEVAYGAAMDADGSVVEVECVVVEVVAAGVDIEVVVDSRLVVDAELRLDAEVVGRALHVHVHA